MDLQQIGAHCAVSTCNILDFLPFTCKCQQTFCRDHIFPDNHACAAVKEATQASSSGGSTAAPLQRCQLEGCHKPTLYAFTTDPTRESCDKCHGLFCVEHRYPDTHACSPPVEEIPPKAESSARTLLQKNFGSNLMSSTSSRSKAGAAKKKKLPVDPVKLAQWKKVELMKLRHRAVPADPKDAKSSPPADQRLTVSVVCGTTEKPFWFGKTTSVGKAIDLVSSQLKLPGLSKPGALVVVDLVSGEQKPLQNDLELARQVEDGDTIALLLGA